MANRHNLTNRNNFYGSITCFSEKNEALACTDPLYIQFISDYTCMCITSVTKMCKQQKSLIAGALFIGETAKVHKMVFVNDSPLIGGVVTCKRLGHCIYMYIS